MKVRHVDFYADEWLGGTAELSPYDRGVYITICALIYSRGERIGIELLRRHCGVHGNALNASLARLETARKIVRNGSEIGQKRSENELEKVQKRVGNGLENEPVSSETKELEVPRARAHRRTINHQPLTIETPNGVSSAPARAKKPLSPVEGIFKGFADALAAIEARDGGVGQPANGALLDGAGTGRSTPDHC